MKLLDQVRQLARQAFLARHRACLPLLNRTLYPFSWHSSSEYDGRARSGSVSDPPCRRGKRRRQYAESSAGRFVVSVQRCLAHRRPGPLRGSDPQFEFFCPSRRTSYSALNEGLQISCRLARFLRHLVKRIVLPLGQLFGEIVAKRVVELAGADEADQAEADADAAPVPDGDQAGRGRWEEHTSE